MKRFIGPIAATAAVGLLGLATQAQAITSTTSIIGNMGITAQTCLQGLTLAVGDGENCMYDGGPSSATGAPFGEVTGPYNHIAYYDSLATPAAFAAGFVTAPGDGKIQQVINGSVTVDDGGNGFGAGDLLSFSLTLTSPGGGDIVRNFGAAGADRYTSMTQVLAPMAASSATANGLGGFDYVIGSEGFPSLLTFAVAGPCLGQAFGSMDCGFSFAAASLDPDGWAGASAAGLGSLESNFGAKTVGSVSGLACVTSGTACTVGQVSFAPLLIGPNGATGGGATAEDVAWDQLLLRVSTDAGGNVVDMAGFDVQDYRVFGTTRCGDQTSTTVGSYSPTCNSWSSGYFTAVVIPVPAAVWLFGSAIGLLGLVRRRAAQ